VSKVTKLKTRRPAPPLDTPTDLDYATLCKELPPHVEPAYDGITVELAG
jgi:hypothetical protein